MGDFNLDTLKYHDLHQTQTFVDNFITYGFTPLISKATNFFRSASTSIDHIWCNTICKNTYTGILNESTSSHKPIFANIATKINEISTDSESVTSYFTQNIEKFESEIHKVSDACKECYSNPNISSKEAQRQFFIILYKTKRYMYMMTVLWKKLITVKKETLLTSHG